MFNINFKQFLLLLTQKGGICTKKQILWDSIAAPELAMSRFVQKAFPVWIESFPPLAKLFATQLFHNQQTKYSEEKRHKM